MSVGVAKIVTNETGGKYTITEIFWNVGDEDVASTTGFKDVTAFDVNKLGHREVGTLVQFYFQQSADGKNFPIISDLIGLPKLKTAEGIYWLKLEVDSEGVQTLSWEDTTDACPE